MKSQNVSSLTEEKALHWYVTLNSDNFSDDDYRAFARWLEADDSHYLAYHRVESLWQTLGELKDDQNLKSLLEQEEKKPQIIDNIWIRTPWIFALSAALCVIVSLSFFGWETHSPKTYFTLKTQSQTIQLDDGSRITLTPQTQLSVQMSRSERLVKMDKGHAFFEVAPDAKRPFTVSSKTISVAVTGTVFGVNINSRSTKVQVHEGSVIVRSDQDKQSLQLSSGEMIASTKDGLGDVHKVLSSDFDNWKKGLIVFKQTSLKHVVEQINPYRQKSIRIASRSIENLAVTMTIHMDELDKLPSFLEELLPIKVIEDEAGHIVFTADRNKN